MTYDRTEKEAATYKRRKEGKQTPYRLSSRLSKGEEEVGMEVGLSPAIVVVECVQGIDFQKYKNT